MVIKKVVCLTYTKNSNIMNNKMVFLLKILPILKNSGFAITISAQIC